MNILEERVVELETRLAHSELAIDDLTQIVRDQNQKMDAILAAFHQMRERMTRLTEAGEGSPQDDKPPPHY